MKKLSQILENKSNEKKIPNGFCILKPGFTDYADEFKNILKTDGWKILGEQMRKLSRDEAEKLYASKKDESFYNMLCDYMSSDKCLCCSCRKDSSDPIGDMNKLKDKVREQWGIDDMKNAMHSSDSLDNVNKECSLCIINEAKLVKIPFALDPINPIAADISSDDGCCGCSCDGNDCCQAEPVDIIKELKIAFCEEMLAWYQYKIIACFLRGANREDICAFFDEAAKDECDDHGNKILNRLHELGANVDDILAPESWNVFANHKFILPSYKTREALTKNVVAEMGAIETYKNICKLSQNICDYVTYDLAKSILIDEEEHLVKLKDLISDTNDF